MLNPNTELRYISPEIGYGIVAAKRLPKGTITWALDPLDHIIDMRANPQYRDYPEVLDRYTFVNCDGHHVLCWDQARFINHSCDANCLSPGFDFEICIRDIEAGEQLTNDYGSLNLEEEMECLCGSPHCRKFMKPDDFERKAAYWDSLLRGAFPAIKSVEQALWPWIQEKEQIDECLANPSRLPSILKHRYAQTLVS